MSYDVAEVRAHFPALREGAAHFDGPGGSQVPIDVAEAVASAMSAAIANRGQLTVAERRADRIVEDARHAMADLLGAQPGGIVFGRSMTQLTYDFSRALAKTWEPGDEVVVTRLDHDANFRPWVQAAQARDAVVRQVAFDPETGELPVDAIAAAVTDRTRLVAVTGASNLIGTRPDVPAIAALAHDVGALCYVDGVHLTPHASVDVTMLGADMFVCSPYKFCGPHLGVLAARPELLATVHPDKLLPATNAVPERFEFGTLPYELLAGTTAAVDFIAGLAPEPNGGRRASLVRSYAAIDAHERRLRDEIEAGLRAVDGVCFYSRAAHRTPTVLFTLDGLAPDDVSHHLAAAGVNAPAGNFYALECARVLALPDGGVRAGVSLYTDDTDVERLVAAVASLRR